VNAILAHVADGNPGARLMPGPGTWERDIANQWFSWLASELHPAFWPFFSPSRYTTDPAGEESVKAAAVLMIRRQLGAADVHLASHEYILGGEISALDGYLFSIARWGTEMLDLPRDVPNVFRHYKQVAANPIVRRCTAVERGRELPSPSASLVARLELSTLDG
jgi:glutathione S-transferase